MHVFVRHTIWSTVLVALVATSATACGGPAPTTQAPVRATTDAPPTAGSRAQDYASDDAAWGKFHSKRFQLSVPLPEGKAWKVDDHSKPDLIAVHAGTTSRLAIVTTQEEELMNRQRCEARAKTMGWVPNAPLTTVDEQVVTGPDAYDSKIWVALDAGKPGGGVEGHVFLFGAFLRRCLLVHLTTAVPSARDEEILAGRLALATSRIVKAITLDPLRTTDEAIVPRDKPDVRR